MKYTIVIVDEDESSLGRDDLKFIFETDAINPNEALANVVKDIPFPDDTTGRAFIIEIIPHIDAVSGSITERSLPY